MKVFPPQMAAIALKPQAMSSPASTDFAGLLSASPPPSPLNAGSGQAPQRAFEFSELGVFGVHGAGEVAAAAASRVVSPGAQPQDQVSSALVAAAQAASGPTALTSPALQSAAAELISAFSGLDIGGLSEDAAVETSPITGRVLAPPPATSSVSAADGLDGLGESETPPATEPQFPAIDPRRSTPVTTSPATSLRVTVTSGEQGVEVVAASAELTLEARSRLLSRTLQTGAELGVTISGVRHNGAPISFPSNNQNGG